MELITAEIRENFLENGRKQEHVHGTDDEIDFHPVVKLFTPDAGGTWLLTELDPEDDDLAFGPCDLGLGFPGVGQHFEIAEVRGKLGLAESPLQVAVAP